MAHALGKASMLFTDIPTCIAGLIVNDMSWGCFCQQKKKKY